MKAKAATKAAKAKRNRAAREQRKRDAEAQEAKAQEAREREAAEREAAKREAQKQRFEASFVRTSVSAPAGGFAVADGAPDGSRANAAATATPPEVAR